MILSCIYLLLSVASEINECLQKKRVMKLQHIDILRDWEVVTVKWA